MLVFIDESGDTGLKINKGSSAYFTVSLVLFEDNDEALRCDQRIQLLKGELSYPPSFEFHFSTNSDDSRMKFLEAISRYDFFHFNIVVNKDPQRLYGEGFKNKESFYKYVCGLVFQNAKPYLKNAIVKFDKSGRALFGPQLANYLKKKMNKNGDSLIKSVKMEHSHSNNLLQLADYVAGVINRTIQQKGNYQAYHKYISPKEINTQIWPK